MKKEKLIILFTVALDVLGMGIVIPILPFYVKEFSASPLAVSWLFSIFSLFAFLSSPVLGGLSDRFGRRPIMIISIISTAIGWLVFASAKALPMLFVGRIIDGLAAGNFSTAQSYLSDIAQDEKERTKNIGLVGMIMGLGLIAGPVVGSLLAQVSLSFPFWFVGGLAGLNAILAYKILPETHNGHRTGKINLNPFRPLALAAKDRQLRSRYLSWIFFGLAIASQQTVFSLYMGDVFGFEASHIGWLFAAMGLVMAINQGYLLSRFWLKRFNESFLEIWLLPVLAFGFLAFASHRAWLFIIGMVINGLTQTIVRAITTSRAAGLAGPQRRGEVMGIMSSIMAFTMFVSPIIAGYLYAVDYSWPFYYGAFALFMAAIAIKCCPLESKKVVDSQNMEDTEIISA